MKIGLASLCSLLVFCALGSSAGCWNSGQSFGDTPMPTIPWQTLSMALPTGAPGWTLSGQIKGENSHMMGIAVSTAGIELFSGNMKAKVDIVDTSMNPLVARPFNIARAVPVDSSKERVNALNLGGHPATQRLNKQSGGAQIVAMVGHRLLVTVDVENAGSEQPALALAQLVNFPLLAASIPR